MSSRHAFRAVFAATLMLAAGAASAGEFGGATPALIRWHYSFGGDARHPNRLSLNGVPLTGLPKPAAGYRGDDDSSVGLRVGMIVLGAGAATALIVSAMGNAAEKNNPAVDNNQNGVACNKTVVTSSCAVGGG